ncbi:MAG: hypothetical protein EA353_12815 [Puniceicoccaceae bacterium]|nr:MAG: hypothetical protein EA353_12815 [Puniceicoccaceae bacterium]
MLNAGRMLNSMIPTTTILRFILFFLLAPAFGVVVQAAGAVQDGVPVVDAGFQTETVILENVDGGICSYDSSGALLQQRRSLDGKAADDDGLREYGESDRFGAARPYLSILAEGVAARTTPPRNAARFEIETTQGVTNRRGHTSQREDVRSRTDFENGQQVRRVDFDHSHGPLGPGHVHPVHSNPVNPSQINTSRPRAPEPGEYLSSVLSDPRIQGGVYRP